MPSILLLSKETSGEVRNIFKLISLANKTRLSRVLFTFIEHIGGVL